ncbi:HypC/HybG/HupF family hydrogenase formation chaperone [Patescibacteria group bacterium]
MCIAAPGKIISIENKIAQVSYPGNIINQAMIIDIPAKIDDYVLVQMGIVIKVLPKEQALASQKAWEESRPSQ